MKHLATDVLIIGSGLSSLTCAALLAKRGIDVLVVEQHMQPGGSCGAFRYEGRTIDQGTAMVFGFGEHGFNPHRFVMNALEEPIDVVHHRYLYRLNYAHHPILFHKDIDQYLEVLGTLFPENIDGIKKFYTYIADLYYHVIAIDSTYMAPSEMSRSQQIQSFLRHPIRTMRIIPLLSVSAGTLLRRFVQSEDVVKFFNKMTSTYCYTSLDETPSILAITMFMENHTGGSYYPVGSSQQLPGKLEKAIERYGGTMCYRTRITKLIFENNNPISAIGKTSSGETISITAKNFVYGGTLYNFYNTLLPKQVRTESKEREILNLEMTYPSVVLYCIVEKSAIPEGTLPIEMFADNPDALDEKEITLYCFSLADGSICGPDEHVVMAIGPSLRQWPKAEDRKNPPWDSQYPIQKEEEKTRLLQVLESHFPGFTHHVRHAIVASPATIERYTMKESGYVAGPKQAMGQDLLNRQHAKSIWANLYFCGEATVMGTGSPAVTISGISAANVLLRDRHMKEFSFDSSMKDVVTVYEEKAPVVRENTKGIRLPSCNAIDDEKELELHDLSCRCQWCLEAPCMNVCPKFYDIPSLMRRLECGNVGGAAKLLEKGIACLTCDAPCEIACIVEDFPIKEIFIKAGKK